MGTHETTIRQMCRSALTKTKGDTIAAYEHFNSAIIKADSAPLERELCSAYRSAALRAWLAETYQAMRSEGLVPRRGKEMRIPTTDYEKPRGDTLRTGDLLHAEMQASAIVKRYLDTFLVNGQPIGDCTAEEVDAAADTRLRDGRFMKLMVSGLPPTGKIRDYHTEEETAALWERAGKQKSALIGELEGIAQ